MCLSAKIFTLVEDEDKFFKKKKVVDDEVRELVDCKDFSYVKRSI